ncbi:MAG: YceD family protein [Oscillospiraceae bacterium]
MVINLKQLYDITGERLLLDYAVDVKKLSLIKGYSFSCPITIKGAIVNRAGVVTLKYSAAFTLHACCDRCLIEFDRAYSLDFEHILVRSLSSENDEYIVTELDKLDMDELVLTDCLLQLPSKMLCKEDCLGLCPVCGTDLNQNECDCNG